MATAAKRQDMPPPGGYKPITFKRMPMKTIFNGWAIIGGYLAMTAGASYLFYLGSVVVHQEELERRSASFAILPMLTAERDREYLKQLRRNRDEEARLMANVEGWEVGTLYGEPIFHTVPKEKLVEPDIMEYFVHGDFKSFEKRATLFLWS